jgi:hypothetical protein
MTLMFCQGSTKICRPSIVLAMIAKFVRRRSKITWIPLPGRTRARAGESPPSEAVIGDHAPVALTTTLVRRRPPWPVCRSR